MIELRQALQQERLQQMRERIQGTMRQIEGCLHELDRLDDGAKVRKEKGERTHSNSISVPFFLALTHSSLSLALSVTFQRNA